MAVTSAAGFPSKGIDFTQVTDTSADFPSVANSTYFYNLADKIVRYKNSTGVVLEIFSAAGGGSGIHALLKPISGRKVSYALTTAATGQTFTQSRLILIPFFPANTFTISEISMFCNILMSGSLCRLLIYSDNNGVPDAKLYESADLDCSTTGFKIATTSFTFTAGSTYWLAFHGGLIATNILQNNIASTYAIANNGSTVNAAQGYFTTSSLGSAPSNITSPALLSGPLPWIGLTQV